MNFGYKSLQRSFNPQPFPFPFRAYAYEFIDHNFLTSYSTGFGQRGWVTEYLEQRDCDQNGCGSKPTCAILLCPWNFEKHFRAYFLCLADLASSFKFQSYLFKKTKKIKIKKVLIGQYLGVFGDRSG